MSILSLSNFLTNTYRDICWKHIFCDAGLAVSTNQMPMGLVNRCNLIMVPEHYVEYDRMQICFPDKGDKLIGGTISYRSFPASLVSGIVFLEIHTNHLLETTDAVSEIYIQFLREIIFRVNDSCKVIFKYTYEHLSNRYYDDISIASLPNIQSDFASIYVQLEKLALISQHVFCIDDAIYFISTAIMALTILVKLAGARSVLQHRSVELIYQLKLFKSFIGAALETNK